MTSTRKKIYIALIVICFAATGFILYTNFFGGTEPTPPVPAVVNNNATGSEETATTIPAGNGSINVIYTAPTVFPADNKFNFAVLDSSKFKTLVPNPDLVLDPSQIGRNDPLKNY